MGFIHWIVLILSSLAGIWVVIYILTVYNGIVRVRNEINKAWFNIDVLLKQRHDEIPNLVGVCREYMQYEQELFKAVTGARLAYDRVQTIPQKMAADHTLRECLSGLIITAENYPGLKADATFQHLSKRLRELEDQIADRRDYYNEYVKNYNIRVERFPDKLVAALFGFKSAMYYQVKERNRQVKEVKFSGSSEDK